MKVPVILSIRGEQRYLDQDPEVIELVTEGSLENLDGGWELTYEESDLTGLAGVTTTFRVEPGRVILDRTGNLRSRMVFEKDVPHDSLYQMPFGALMITVCAKYLFFDILPDGGVVDLLYTIEIENNAAGTVDYHLDIRAK